MAAKQIAYCTSSAVMTALQAILPQHIHTRKTENTYRVGAGNPTSITLWDTTPKGRDGGKAPVCGVPSPIERHWETQTKVGCWDQQRGLQEIAFHHLFPSCSQVFHSGIQLVLLRPLANPNSAIREAVSCVEGFSWTEAVLEMSAAK